MNRKRLSSYLFPSCNDETTQLTAGTRRGSGRQVLLVSLSGAFEEILAQRFFAVAVNAVVARSNGQAHLDEASQASRCNASSAN